MAHLARRARRQSGPLLLITLASLLLSTTVVRAHDPGLSTLDVTVHGDTISVSLALAASDAALVSRVQEDPAYVAAYPVQDDPAYNAQLALGDLVRGAIRLSVDDVALQPVVDTASVEEGGTRIHLSFVTPPNPQFPTPNCQPLTPNSQAATPNSQAPTPNSQGPTPNSQGPTPNSQLPTPNCQPSTLRRLTITSDLPKRLSRGHRELLTVQVDGGAATEKLLDAESDSVTIDLAASSSSAARAAWSFLTLGVHHILSGYDHLVFLAGLLLAAHTLRQLVVALTAFTAAHSVSLALVVVAGVQAPSSIVEPLIAASIAWVGVENLIRRQHPTRWVVVFGFGLIHGFGFAGALSELGFGSSIADVAIALLSFNGGVEAGQLAAAAAMLPLVWAIRSRPQWQARLVPLCSLSIAMVGGYWLLQRL